MIRTARTVLVAALAVTFVAVVGTLLVPRLAGWTPYIVTSGSMSPTFDAGDVVLAAPVETDEIEGGDILTYMTDGGMTTHRVYKRVTEEDTDGARLSFVTKGDANEDPDVQRLDPRNVVGKAKIAVPRLGYFVDFAKSPLGAGVLTALILLVVMTGNGARKTGPANLAEDGDPVEPDREKEAVQRS